MTLVTFFAKRAVYSTFLIILNFSNKTIECLSLSLYNHFLLTMTYCIDQQAQIKVIVQINFFNNNGV